MFCRAYLYNRDADDKILINISKKIKKENVALLNVNNPQYALTVQV